jgi:hypothetical protein
MFLDSIFSNVLWQVTHPEVPGLSHHFASGDLLRRRRQHRHRELNSKLQTNFEDFEDFDEEEEDSDFDELDSKSKQ